MWTGAVWSAMPSPSVRTLLKSASVPRMMLRDGSRVDVRPIAATDKELIRRGFERLSPESRYRRFLSSMPALDDRALAYLTELDHHDHEALVALDGDEAVGVARFVRDPA